MRRTHLSSIELHGRRAVLMQLHQRSILDAEGMAEALKAVKEVCSEPRNLLIEIPEDADFNMTFMKRDHFKDSGAPRFLCALALLTTNPFLERLMALYFAYYPQPFPVRIFNDRRSALEWIDQSGQQLGMNVA